MSSPNLESASYRPINFEDKNIEDKEVEKQAKSPVTTKEASIAQTTLSQAEGLIKEGNFSRGVELLENLAIQNTNDNQLLEKLANVYVKYTSDPQRNTHLTQAIAIYRTLNERNTTNTDYMINQLKAQAFRNDFGEMEQTIDNLKSLGQSEELKELAKSFMEEPTLFLKAVFIYQHLGETEFPRPDLLRLNPEIEKLWEERGEVYQYSTLEHEMGADQTNTNYRVKPPMTSQLEELQRQIDSKKYEIKLDANPYAPIRSNKPDPVKAELWVKEHPDQISQQVASEIKSHTTHISFDEFRESLKESVEDFNSRLGPEETYVVAVREGKSNKWVLELALPHLKKLPNQVLDMSHLKRYLATNPNAKVVFLDDASYSGEQLHSFIKEFVPTESQSPVEVIVPYLTNFAENNVQHASEKVHICKHQVMKTVREEIKDDEILKYAHDMYFSIPRNVTKDRGVDSHTLTIFDHKVADYLSTLEDVYKFAVVRDKDGNNVSKSELRSMFPNALQFVPPTLECYKEI